MKKTYLSETMTKLTMLVLISVTAFSCAQTKRDRIQGQALAGIRDSDAATDSTCSNGTSTGIVFDNGQIQNGFYANAQAFVSGWMDPSKLGQIDGSQTSTSTGIDVTGSFTFNGNNLVQASSSFKLQIYDSYVVSGQYSPITLNFDSSTYSQYPTCVKTLTGYKNGNNVTITASDCYGTITTSGTINGQKLIGYVQFQNKASYGGGAGRSGTLGQFSLASCVVH